MFSIHIFWDKKKTKSRNELKKIQRLNPVIRNIFVFEIFENVVRVRSEVCAHQIFELEAETCVIRRKIFCWSRWICTLGVENASLARNLHLKNLFSEYFCQDGLVVTNGEISWISGNLLFFEWIECEFTRKCSFSGFSTIFYPHHITKVNPRDKFEQFAQVLTQMAGPIRKVTPGIHFDN